MSKTYLAIQLDGKDVGLKFNMGAYDVMLEYSGIEMTTDKGSKDTNILVYAGMVGNCMAKDEEPDFTIDDVRKKIKKMDVEEFVELSKTVNDFAIGAYNLKKDAPSEGSGDTQRQTLNVA